MLQYTYVGYGKFKCLHATWIVAIHGTWLSPWPPLTQPSLCSEYRGGCVRRDSLHRGGYTNEFYLYATAPVPLHNTTMLCRGTGAGATHLVSMRNIWIYLNFTCITEIWRIHIFRWYMWNGDISHRDISHVHGRVMSHTTEREVPYILIYVFV